MPGTAKDNKPFDNTFLSIEAEDQFNSHLDLTRFCTPDKTLELNDGMKRTIRRYVATNGTEKLQMGEGNTKSITASYKEVEYNILLAQNRFEWYDEQAMKDKNIVLTGVRHQATDLYNTINDDVYAEYLKTSLNVDAAKPDYNAFVDATSLFKSENEEELELFAFVSPKTKGVMRKALGDDLKYVESYARNGYVGTVAGVHIFVKKDAKDDKIPVATKKAVTMFTKTGTQVEQEREGNTRLNRSLTRKYYVVALTNETQAVTITLKPTPEK